MSICRHKAQLLCAYIVPNQYISLLSCRSTCSPSTQEATLPLLPGPVALTVERLIVFPSMASSDQGKLFSYFKTAQACQYFVGILSYPAAVNHINKLLVDSTVY